MDEVVVTFAAGMTVSSVVCITVILTVSGEEVIRGETSQTRENPLTIEVSKVRII